MDELKLLSDREIAALLGVSRASVWRWTRRGLLPAPLIVGQRTRRWRRGDVEAALDKRNGARSSTRDLRP